MKNLSGRFLILKGKGAGWVKERWPGKIMGSGIKIGRIVVILRGETRGI